MKRIIPFIPVLGAYRSQYPIREKYFGIFFIYHVMTIGLLNMATAEYLGRYICNHIQ